MSNIEQLRIVHLFSWVILGVATAVAMPVGGGELVNVVGFGLAVVAIAQIGFTWQYMEQAAYIPQYTAFGDTSKHFAEPR